MRKGLTFHTTKRTIFISLMALIIISFFVLSFAISITFFNINEPLILSSFLKIEEKLGIHIEVGSIETHLFTRLSLHDITIDDTLNRIMTIDSVIIDAPWYTLLPRFLTNQSIPIYIDQGDIKLSSHHLTLLEQTELSTQIDQNIPFSLEIVATNLSLSYTGKDDSLKGEIPSIKLALNKGKIVSFDTFISSTDYQSQERMFFLSNLNLKGEVQGDGEINATLMSEYIQTNIESIGVEGEIHSSLFSYQGNIESMNGSIEGSFSSSTLFYRMDDTLVEYESEKIDILAIHKDSELEEVIAKSSNYRVSTSPYLLQGESFNLIYLKQRENVSIKFDDESLLSIDKEPFVSFLETQLDVSLIDNVESIRLEGKSIKLLETTLLHTFIETELVDELAIFSPYILISKSMNNQNFMYETSGTIQGKTNFLTSQSIDFDFFSDGEADQSFTFKKVQLSLINLTSSLLSQTFSLEASYDEILLSPLEITLKEGNSLSISLQRNMAEKDNQILLKSDKTNISSYKPLIDMYAPLLSPYIAHNTTSTGEIYVELDDELEKGRVNGSIAFQSIAIGKDRINGASTLLASMNSTDVIVDLATITTTGVRVSFGGTIDRLTWLPKGVLDVQDVESGSSLASIDFTLLENQEVGYTFTSSLLSSLKVEGLARYASTFSFVETNGDIEIFNESYPFISSFNNQSGTIETHVPGLAITIDLISKPGHLGITTIAKDFVIPLPSLSFIHSSFSITGALFTDFSLSDNSFIIEGPDIELGNIFVQNIQDGRLNTSISISNTRLLLDTIVYTDNVGSLTGNIDLTTPNLISLLAGDTKSLTFQGKLTDEEGDVGNLSINHDITEPEISIMTLFVDRFPLERFSGTLKNTYASLEGAGVSNFTDSFDMEGGINLFQDLPTPLFGALQFSIMDDGITLYDGFLERGNFSAYNFSSFFSFDGTIDAKVDLLHKKSYIWRESDTKMSVGLKTLIGEKDNFFDYVTHLFDELTAIDSISLTHSSTQIFGMVDMADGSHKISRDGHIFRVTPLENGSLSATYNSDTNFLSLSATKDFLFPLEGEGIVSSTDISLDLSYLALDLTLLNAILGEPVIIFEKGLFEGDLLIEGPLSNPQYFGTMSSDEVTISLYWTGNQKISVVNPVITLAENLFTLPYTKAIVGNREERDSEGIFKAQMLFENWNISNYQLDATIDKGTLSLSIPIPQVPLYIEADASGTFGLIGTLFEEKIYGDIYIPKGNIGFEIPTLPNWFLPKARTSIEMDFTSGKNITFVYPNETSPIVSATVADNQKLNIISTAPSMITTLQGDIALRGGEIYYIQENFYITEGSLLFPKEQVGNIEAAEPRISLRARLRKFDNEGNRIDIFLILQNDTLSSINPRFDSFPLRTNNEILQILGQNLLNTNFAENPDGGFQSVLSAASAATDVISRLGLIQGGGITFGFSSVIRESLGLDVFSIRSNLLQNILIEAIPGMSNEVSISPISRYLDNTTLYLGKYLLDKLYLQGLVTFRRDFTGTRSSFLAEDLAIDTELSIEWLNDLATFSFFTQPEELSLFNLFDTMGFSVTKNFEF